MPDIMTIREAVTRAKAEGIPISEHTLRAWVKAGKIPVRLAGNKQLVSYANIIRYLSCEDGGDLAPHVAVADTGKNSRIIRRA